jgi:hypothetical protein
MNELANIKQQGISPHRQYADEHLASAIAGDLLRHAKGEWLRGPDKEPVKDDLSLLCNMDELYTGYICYEKGQVVETAIGRVSDYFAPPKREDLGHSDRNLWEIGPSGAPVDPWTRNDRIVMREMGTGSLLTFSTSSMGGLKALAQLCQDFDHARVKHGGRWPVVKLDAYSYVHRTRGIIWNPRFPIVDWASWDDETDNVTPAAPGPITGHGTADASEEIPF